MTLMVPPNVSSTRWNTARRGRRFVPPLPASRRLSPTQLTVLAPAEPSHQEQRIHALRSVSFHLILNQCQHLLNHRIEDLPPQDAPLDREFTVDESDGGIVRILRVEGAEEERRVVVLAAAEVDLVGFRKGVEVVGEGGGVELSEGREGREEGRSVTRWARISESDPKVKTAQMRGEEPNMHWVVSEKRLDELLEPEVEEKRATVRPRPRGDFSDLEVGHRSDEAIGSEILQTHESRLGWSQSDEERRGEREGRTQVPPPASKMMKV